MKKISWLDKIGNEKVLQRVNETKTMLDTVKKRKHAWFGRHVLRLESLLHDIIEGIMRGKAIRGRKRMHLMSDLMKAKYVALKRTAEDRKEWQKLLRAAWKCYTCFSVDYLMMAHTYRRPRH